MKYWIAILSILCSTRVSAQVVVQTWVDPCNNQVQTATFPINGPGVTIIYRNQAKTFTAMQATTGELHAWINQVTTLIPCPIVNNPVVTQTAAAAATQAASSAASSVATNVAASTPPPTTSTSTSTPDTKPETKSETSSSSDSKSESKSEEKKSESKKDDKKKEDAKSNPIMIASDLTIGQTPDGKLTELATVGVSRSSLMGNESYGATGMIWSSLDKGALSISYTAMGFQKGKLSNIKNTSLTTAYMNGTWLTISAYTYVKPHPAYGVYGFSAGMVNTFIPNKQQFILTDSAQIVERLSKYKKLHSRGYYPSDTMTIITRNIGTSTATSMVIFWMPPAKKISTRITVSPQIFIMGSPISYNPITKLTTSTSVSMMMGTAVDYKLTKRFGISSAYRAMISPKQPILNYILIGSRIIL